jgi:hypothetical protein
MATPRQIIEKLTALPEDQKDLHVYACDSRSGVTDRISGNFFLKTVSGNEDGDVSEWEEVGNRYLRTSTGI